MRVCVNARCFENILIRARNVRFTLFAGRVYKYARRDVSVSRLATRVPFHRRYASRALHAGKRPVRHPSSSQSEFSNVTTNLNGDTEASFYPPHLSLRLQE